MKKVIKKVTSWLSGKLRSKRKTAVETQSKTSVPAQQKEHPRRGYLGKNTRPPHPREARGQRFESRTQHQSPRHPARPVKPEFRRGPHVSTIPKHDWDISTFDVPSAEGKTRFHDLGLPNEILHAVADLNFNYCTPVQAGILPQSLQGRDCTGRAQTGTGKSAAFLITILAHLLRKPLTDRRKASPRALILAPTRELVLQIEKDARSLAKYTNTTIVAVFGGMDYERQKRWLDGHVDIVVATPGRLIDFKNQRHIHLNHVEILVIDEADRMLDMGFIPDIRKIVLSTPHKDKRQTMFFTATFTPEVKRLAGQWTNNAHDVDIEPEKVSVEAIDQRVYIVPSDDKLKLLYNMIDQEQLERVIVFGNRKDQTHRLAEQLMSRNVSCGLLSGDVSQHERVKTLEGFRQGRFRVLVATDVAARGLHIEGVSHVVNFNLPLDPEDYVHRIGRTGRAGASGISVSFADEEDGMQIPVIEEFIGRKLPSIYPPDEWLKELPPPDANARKIHLQPKKQYDNQRKPSQRPHRNRGGRPPQHGGANTR